MKKISLFFVLVLCGCGTFTGIPSHGGGKRFAIEQMLVSSSARQSISEIPISKFAGKSVLIDVNAIFDEGGGNIQGGRMNFSPYLSSSYVNSSNNTSSTAQISTSKTENTYTKDQVFFSSDVKYFTNLIQNFVIRNGGSLAPTDEDGFDYILEINLDVFGTWRSRLDFFFTNDEKLKAITSFEYVITPVKKRNNSSTDVRLSGRAGHQSEYQEKYFLWTGPFESNVTTTKFLWNDFLNTFGNGPIGFQNIDNTSPKPTNKSIDAETTKPILMPHLIQR